MTAIVILEDERPARERLEQSILQADPHAKIVATMASVADATRWLSTHDAPDLIFADVQLADGLCLELFDRTEVSCPVIFCTAYDEYMVDAMERNGIDYLLKPIQDPEVARALAKYRRLQAHFSDRLANLNRDLDTHRRRRLIARSNDGFVVLLLDDIAYFTVTDGTTMAVVRSGMAHPLDRTLGELEGEMDPHQFFRLNRQVLARGDAVARFRPYFKGRILVELDPPARGDVIVSHENAARFKAWLASG